MSEVDVIRKANLSEEGTMYNVALRAGKVCNIDTEDASETDLAPKLEDGRYLKQCLGLCQLDTLQFCGRENQVA